MAEDEVKKTGGQVDGKGLAHFISSFPAGGADATGLSQHDSIPIKKEISKLC